VYNGLLYSKIFWKKEKTYMIKKVFLLVFFISLQTGFSEDIDKKLFDLPAFEEKQKTFCYFSAGAFTHMSIETPIGGPTIGLGFRYKDGNFGIGGSVNASSFIILPYLSLRGELLLFLSDAYYTGVSMEVGRLYVPGLFGSEGEWQMNYHPEILIGKQMITSSGKTTFSNFGICPPMWLDGQWSKPFIFFRYGIGF